MLQNLLKTLNEQTPALDGAVNHDEFKPSDRPLPVVVPLDAEQREDLVSYVVQHTSSGHTYMTAKGQRGVVYYDERGRASSSLMDEMTDETVVFLAQQKGYEFPPAEGLVTPAESIPQQEGIRSEIAGILAGVTFSGTAVMEEAPTLKQKPGEDYWFVMSGGKKVGGVSKDSSGKFDGAKRSASKDDAFKKGFDTKEAAAAWVAGSKAESLDEEAAPKRVSRDAIEDMVRMRQSVRVHLGVKGYLIQWTQGPKGQPPTTHTYTVGALGAAQRKPSRQFHAKSQDDGAKADALKKALDYIEKSARSKEWALGKTNHPIHESRGPNAVWKRLQKEFSDWPLKDLKQAALSVSPRMNKDAREVQARYQKLMTEASAYVDMSPVKVGTWVSFMSNDVKGMLKTARGYEAFGKIIDVVSGEEIVVSPGPNRKFPKGLKSSKTLTLNPADATLEMPPGLKEEYDDNDFIEAHKKAGKAMATVKGAGRQFGDGWSSTVTMGPGRKAIYLTVGINEHLKSGGYLVWLGVDLAGFKQDRGHYAQEVERNEIKRAAAALKRYASEVTTNGAQNGVSRAHAVVSQDKIEQAMKALPAIAKKFAQDVWDTRMSAVTESAEPLEEVRVDGKVVKVGDWISFKSDTEQDAQISKISGSRITVKAPPEGFHGDYIRGDEFYTLQAKDAWLESSAEQSNLEEKIQIIHPYAHGMWVIGVEDALKKKLGKQYTWKKPILSSGANTLMYKWYARKTKGEFLSRQFIATITLDTGADLFDVKLQVVDPDSQVVQEKSYRHVYIDQVVDPRFLTDWLRK